MKQYVGLDVSMEETKIHVLDEEGGRVWRGKCRSEPGTIAATIHKRASEAVRIGIETGPLTTWLYTELVADGLPMVCLDARQIVATIGEIVATGVAQRVRVDVAETSTPGGGDDEIVHRLTGQGLASLGQEQPGQAIRAGGKMTPDGTELVPRDRLLDRKAVLEPAYPQAGGGEVEVRPAQADGLAHAQPVTVHHEQEQMVARAMPALPGAAQQPVDLALAQEIFGTEAAVDCLPVPAFDNLPLGHPFATGSKGSIGLAPPRGAFDRRCLL